MAAKILVVEDDPDIMRLLLHALRAAGFEVVMAYGGEDAIKKVKTHRPDLVLTDLAMPEVGGVAVIEEIKANPETRGIPVIAVTAYVWDRLAQSAGLAGCNGYLAKPFTVKQLLDEVRKYLKPDVA